MTHASTASIINLKSLGGSLSLLLLSLAVTATVVITLLQFARQTEQAHLNVLAQQTATRLASARNDVQEIRSQIAQYQQLVQRGRTTPERRQDWVATLRHIQTSRHLLGLDYTITPQRPLDDKNPASGGYQFLSSPMKLEMPLLHEDDLLGLLADFSAQVPALVSVKHCKLERIPTGQLQPNSPTLKVSCNLDLITLQEGS